MKRGKPLGSDPVKAREWRDRARRRALERQQSKAKEPKTPSARSKSTQRPRRNDGPWRKECVDRYGEWCRVCGTTRHVQADHIHPRGQGGKSVVENCLFLCAKHHEDKTNSLLKIERSWLEEDQIVYLAGIRWVAWDHDGEPYGHGWKHFATVTVTAATN